MQSEYRVKRIYTEEDGGVVAKCYDILYGEDFEKYLGFPDDFDGKENASNLLQDSTYAMSDELRAEIEELFHIAEFNDEQDYDGYQFFDFDDDFDDEDDDEDEMNQRALAMLGKRESFNLREALNQIDLNTDNKYDLLNLYESCDLKENEKRALANIVYDQEDPSVIYDTLNNRYVSGEEIGMPERVKDGVIHEDLEDVEFVMSYYMPDLLISDIAPGKYEASYRGNDSVSVIVEFDTSYGEFVYTIDGEGPYSHSSYEYIQGDIERALDSKLRKNESKSIKENVQSPLQTCLDAWKKLEQESPSYDEAIDLVTTAEQLVGYYIDRYEEEAYSTYLGNRGILSNVTPEMDKEIISLFKQITDIEWTGEYLEESVEDDLGDDELNAFYKGYTEEDEDENSAYNKLKKNANSIKEEAKVTRKHNGKSLTEGFYRGCEGVTMIGHGEWSDPELEYDGYLFNYWDIEDALWNDFLDETGWTDVDGDEPVVENEFNEYVKARCVDYLDDCISGGAFTGLSIEGDIVDFPNGEYYYVGYEDGKISLDNAYNSGRAPEYSIDYDFDESIDTNLQRLYDYAIEKSPWLNGDDDLDESKSIKESDEETPYTKEEVERELKSITHNFTDKEGELKCGFEEEKNFGVEILKQHYKVVEVSGDDRRDGTWYHISFAEPLNKNESVDPALLSDCPECGDKSFDTKKGKCTKCNYRESLKEYYSDDEEDDYEDSDLSPKQIIRILKSHGILHHMDGDKIMALESYEKLDDGTYKDNYIDVTNYTVHQLRDFLGY